MRAFQPDTIIAVGGGSPMDAAKVLPDGSVFTIWNWSAVPALIAPISDASAARSVSRPWMSSRVWPSTCPLVNSQSDSHASDAHTMWYGASAAVMICT